jgi:hypothetical protein
VTAGQLRKRIARSVEQDKELVIDPRFFRVLPGQMAGISAAQVQFKRGQAANELTRYRYDVTLHVGERVAPIVRCESMTWGESVKSLTDVALELHSARWSAVQLKGIPNARVAKEAAAERLIHNAEERLDAGTIRRQLNERNFDGVDPNELFELADASGYEAIVTPGESAQFDAKLLNRQQLDRLSQQAPAPTVVEAWRTYANDPLQNGFRQQLIPLLRDYLSERLPAYMIPSAWLLMKQLPLTRNGKVDRQALPNAQERSEEMGEYVAPRSPTERALAEIWTELLQVDQVGINDNFFHLGGHSLLATRVVTRIRSLWQVGLPLRVIFDAPTVEQLAARVDEECSGREQQEIARIENLSRELQEEIDDMQDDAIAAKIAELEMQLQTGAVHHP